LFIYWFLARIWNLYYGIIRSSANISKMDLWRKRRTTSSSFLLILKLFDEFFIIISNEIEDDYDKESPPEYASPEKNKVAI
jgi:hypothetical protein